MQELDKLRQMLDDMNLQSVARGAGVHPNALYRLMAGGTNPRYKTVQLVLAYLKRHKQAVDND